MPGKPFEELNLYAAQRVLFINNGGLLDACVLKLIGAGAELEVLQVDYDGDDLLIKDICAIAPDVLLMLQPGAVRLERLFKSVLSNPALEKMRVILYHTDDNTLDVFCKQRTRAIQSADFLALAQGASLTL